MIAAHIERRFTNIHSLLVTQLSRLLHDFYLLIGLRIIQVLDWVDLNTIYICKGPKNLHNEWNHTITTLITILLSTLRSIVVSENTCSGVLFLCPSRFASYFQSGLCILYDYEILRTYTQLQKPRVSNTRILYNRKLWGLHNTVKVDSKKLKVVKFQEMCRVRYP